MVFLLGAAALAGCGGSGSGDDDDGDDTGGDSGLHQDGGTDATTDGGGDASGSNDGSAGSDGGDATTGGGHDGGDGSAGDGSSGDDSGTDGEAGGPGTDAGDAAVDSGHDSGPDAGPTATIHYYGRFDTTETYEDPNLGVSVTATPAEPIFDWSGSGIQATFVGTGIAVKLTNYPYSLDGVNELQVLIDGTPTTSTTSPGLKLLNGGACSVSSNPCTGTYTLASGLADKQHTVEIYKRTEALYGYVQFQGFSNVSGGSGDWALVPTVDPYPRRIEFIGDSITVGYGVLGPNANCEDDGDYNDAYVSFSGDTAHQLGASFVGIAYSGKGVYVDYNGDTTANDPSNPEMPAQWLRTWENNPNSTYNFGTQVDAVVINLGTNDFSYQSKDPGAPFVSAYQNLVGSVRAKYPDAYILMLVGPIVTRYNPFDGAAAQLKSDLDSIVSHFAALNDHNMADLNVGEEPDCGSDPDSCGCSDHPNVAEDSTVAGLVAANIKAAKGW